MIGIPLIPVRLHVSGLTEIQTERKIAEVLEANGLVSHPEVSVVVREKKSKPITVVGAVAHPVVYSADRQVTLIEALAEAGGILSDAGDQVVITRPERDPLADAMEPPAISPEDTAPARDHDTAPPADAPPMSAPTSSVAPTGPAEPVGKTAAAPSADAPQLTPPALSDNITINLNQILEAGDMSNNIVLQPGDVVTVPHAGIIYILGAVNRPGGYTVSNDRAQLTTLKLLAVAGGLNRTAKSDHAVIVRKDSTGKQHEVEVDLKKVMRFQDEDVQLHPSDILYVPNSAAKQTLVKAGELALAVASAVLIYRLVL